MLSSILLAVVIISVIIVIYFVAGITISGSEQSDYIILDRKTIGALSYIRISGKGLFINKFIYTGTRFNENPYFQTSIVAGGKTIPSDYLYDGKDRLSWAEVDASLPTNPEAKYIINVKSELFTKMLLKGKLVGAQLEFLDAGMKNVLVPRQITSNTYTLHLSASGN